MERKVCFITGSGSSNGRGMAIRLADMGYDICLHHSGSNPEMAKETQRIIQAKGVDCKLLEEDMTQSGAAGRLFEKFRAEYDRLDLFINNSGKTKMFSLMEASEEDFNFILNLNFRACYFCVAEAGKFMREKGIKGNIVIIASNHHLVNFPSHFSAYASAKAAMVRFTKWAALEFSHHGIRVNCIAPGYIDPGYEKRENFNANRDRISTGIPLKRYVPSEELAEIAAFLDSPSARSITGQTINVDGGDSLLNAPLDSYHFEKD